MHENTDLSYNDEKHNKKSFLSICKGSESKLLSEHFIKILQGKQQT